jgi:hypothetical protein
LDKHTIRGIVAWPHDTPVVGAQISLRHPGERLRRGQNVTTDEQGRFTLEGLKGYEYEIHVYWRDNESVTSEVEKLNVIGDIKDLKIMLSKQW